MAGGPPPPHCAVGIWGGSSHCALGAWGKQGGSSPRQLLRSPRVGGGGGVFARAPPAWGEEEGGGGMMAFPLFVPAAPDYDKSQWINEKEKLGLDFPNVWRRGGGGAPPHHPCASVFPISVSPPPISHGVPPPPLHIPLSRCPHALVPPPAPRRPPHPHIPLPCCAPHPFMLDVLKPPLVPPPPAPLLHRRRRQTDPKQRHPALHRPQAQHV